MRRTEKLIWAFLLPVTLGLGISACAADAPVEPSATTGSPCPQSSNEALAGEKQACAEWAKTRLDKGRSLILEDNLNEAELLLASFTASSAEIESERLYLLYSIAKLRNDHQSMAHIARQVAARAGGTPYAALIRGVEVCIRGECESAIADLEYANSSISNPTATGYLAAAYAYAGRHRDAEPLVDQIRPMAASVDDLVLYISVGTYLSVGRDQDAKAIAAAYFSSNGPPETFAEKQAMSLLR